MGYVSIVHPDIRLLRTAFLPDDNNLPRRWPGRGGRGSTGRQITMAESFPRIPNGWKRLRGRGWGGRGLGVLGGDRKQRSSIQALISPIVNMRARSSKSQNPSIEKSPISRSMAASIEAHTSVSSHVIFRGQ